jgi:thymidylate kinase
VGEWLKLDVVTALSYGRFHELSTRAGTACLERARRAAGVMRLDPADELWTLLLHCLLDKGTIRDDHARRLGELALASTAGSCLESEIRPILPDGWTPERAVASVRAADWPALEALGRELARSWERRRPVATRAARLRARAMRKAYRLLVGARPRGCRIALLGPDGAGKSTVTSRLAETFPLRVHTVYAGLYPAGSRRRRRVPGLGLAQKVVRLRIASARARLRQLRGSLVVFDRYPYDAILPTDLTSWRARARRRLLASSCARPDLTVLLDAPAEVLFRRSGEHGVEALEAQRSRYRALESRLSLAVVDTVGDPDDVLRRVTALVWSEYVRRARRSG